MKNDVGPTQLLQARLTWPLTSHLEAFTQARNNDSALSILKMFLYASP